MRRHGMTLVEVLIALGVIALLSGIAIVALRGFRDNAMQTTDQTRIRASAADFLSYAVDNEERLPNVGFPENNRNAWWYGDGTNDLPLQVSCYLGQIRGWPTILHRWSGESRPHWQSLNGTSISPDQLEQLGLTDSTQQLNNLMPTRFEYPEVFLSHPNAWNGEHTMISDVEYAALFQNTLLSDVVAPSAKGILVGRDVPQPPNHLLIAFTDGSASSLPVGILKPHVPPPGSFNPAAGRAVSHTLHGVAGRDR